MKSICSLSPKISEQEISFVHSILPTVIHCALFMGLVIFDADVVFLVLICRDSLKPEL